MPRHGSFPEEKRFWRSDAAHPPPKDSLGGRLTLTSPLSSPPPPHPAHRDPWAVRRCQSQPWREGWWRPPFSPGSVAGTARDDNIIRRTRTLKRCVCAMGYAFSVYVFWGRHFVCSTCQRSTTFLLRDSHFPVWTARSLLESLICTSSSAFWEVSSFLDCVYSTLGC